MELKIEYSGDGNSLHPVDYTMTGDLLEIYDKGSGLWCGLELSESEQLDLMETLWWRLYHRGAIDERPTELNQTQP